MDQYPIEAAGSTIENNPMYRVFFKQPIDPIRLEESFLKAIKSYPLFGTKVAFDQEYYLIDNDKQLKIIKAKEDERPRNFGRNTNDYPWMVCYEGKKMTFEWLHGITDGAGALDFLKQMLVYYCKGAEVPKAKTLVAPGLEPFFDKNEKGINYAEEEGGFDIKNLPTLNRGYVSDYYCLKANTQEILALAKNTKSSVAPIMAALFAKALRMHLPASCKNKNVACNVVMDLRRPLNYATMHNCSEYKRITLTDYRNNLSYASLFKEYKHVLDEARLKPNIIRIITDRVKMFKMYHILPSKPFLKFCVKMVGLLMKNRDCNFVLTYPGKIDLPDDIKDKIDNIDFKVWHDFGQCILAAVDYEGNFNLNISINYQEKGIVEDFIKLSHGVGINWEVIETGLMEQSHFEE